jgi:hypothetical protein
MAIEQVLHHNGWAVFLLLSSDAKPTAATSPYSGSIDTGSMCYETDTNQMWSWDGSAWLRQDGRESSIEFVIDGGGSAITTGEKGHIEVPFDCTVTAARVLADQSGSIVVDIWKDTYANFPPVDGDSITASAPPTLSTAQKSEDSTLTGWTTSLTKGDILAYNVDSITTCTRVVVSLTVVKA